MATRSELVLDVRDHVNDPSTAANFLYPNAQIIDAVNRAYRQVSAVIRRHSPGYFQKLGYLSSSTTSFSYTLPTDHVRLIGVRVDTTGTDLSATPGSTEAEVLDFVPPAVFYQHQNGDSTNRVYSFRGRSLLIAPTFDIAASNSIELWYEYSPTTLSGDNDEPDFPDHYHDILVPMAARWIKASKNLDTSFEENEINSMMTSLLIDLKTMHTDTEQFRSALHRTPNWYNDGTSISGVHGDTA